MDEARFIFQLQEAAPTKGGTAASPAAPVPTSPTKSAHSEKAEAATDPATGVHVKGALARFLEGAGYTGGGGAFGKIIGGTPGEMVGSILGSAKGAQGGLAGSLGSAVATVWEIGGLANQLQLESAGRYRAYTPDVALADARNKVSGIMQDIDQAQKYGPRIAQSVEAEGEKDRAWQKLKDAAGNFFAPVGQARDKIETALFKGGADVLDFLDSLAGDIAKGIVNEDGSLNFGGLSNFAKEREKKKQAIPGTFRPGDWLNGFANLPDLEIKDWDKRRAEDFGGAVEFGLK